MQNNNELQDIKDIKNTLKSIDNSLKVILTCVLLPKDGPNWDFYESLFRFAEENVKGSLVHKVEDILSTGS